MDSYYKRVAAPSRNLVQLTFNELLRTDQRSEDARKHDQRIQQYNDSLLDRLSGRGLPQDQAERSLIDEKMSILMPAASCVVRASLLLSPRNHLRGAWRKLYIDSQKMWRQHNNNEQTGDTAAEVSEEIAEYLLVFDGASFMEEEQEVRDIVRFSGILESCIVLAHMEYNKAQKTAKV